MSFYNPIYTIPDAPFHSTSFYTITFGLVIALIIIAYIIYVLLNCNSLNKTRYWVVLGIIILILIIVSVLNYQMN